VKRQWARLLEGRGVDCPICGHDHGCLMAVDKSAIYCLRVQDGCARYKDGKPICAKGGSMGWLHRLDGRVRTRAGTQLRVSMPGPIISASEWRQQIKNMRAVCNPRREQRLADELGVSAATLRRMGVGYDLESGCYTFPMVDGRLNPCGIRLRSLDGRRKGAVKGSKNGLFVPTDYEAVPLPPGLVNDEAGPLILVLPEGPTDAAAALELGFRAIGRPNAMGGVEQLVTLLSNGPTQDVVVFADNDSAKWRKGPDGKRMGEAMFPGIEGALALCKALMRWSGRLRFCLPPRAKDLRRWMQEGGGLAAINAILSAHDVDRNWMAAAEARLERKREEAKRGIADQPAHVAAGH
jgi:hypothetical protein